MKKLYDTTRYYIGSVRKYGTDAAGFVATTGGVVVVLAGGVILAAGTYAAMGAAAVTNAIKSVGSRSSQSNKDPNLEVRVSKDK